MTDKYRQTKRGHMSTLVSKAKRRAKDENLPFDIDLKYVLTLPSTHCPMLDLELAWCSGSTYREDNAPSLDKIDPKKGYVKGNVTWVSWRANRIKNDGTAQEHFKIANWLKNRPLSLIV